MTKTTHRALIATALVLVATLLAVAPAPAYARFPSMFGPRFGSAFADPFLSRQQRQQPLFARPQRRFQEQENPFFRQHRETPEERQTRLRLEQERAEQQRQAAEQRKQQQRLQQLRSYEQRLLQGLQTLGQYEDKYASNLEAADAAWKEHMAREQALKNAHEVTRRDLARHATQKQRIREYVADQERRRQSAAQDKQKYIQELEAVRKALYGDNIEDQRSHSQGQGHEQQQAAPPSQRRHFSEPPPRQQQQQQQQQQQPLRGSFIKQKRVVRGQPTTSATTNRKPSEDMFYEVDEDGNKWQAGGIWVGEVDGDQSKHSSHEKGEQRTNTREATFSHDRAESAEPSDAEMVAEILEYLKQRGF